MLKFCSNINCLVHEQYQSTNDKYCWKCGNRMMTAPECACGRNRETHFEYCPRCGKQFNNKKGANNELGERTR